MVTIPDEPVAGFWTPANMKTYKTAILELQAVNPFTPTFNQAIASRTASQNVATSTWTALGNSTTELTSGTGFSVGPSGIACAFTGWVKCEGVFFMQQNTAGARRLIGVAALSDGSPSYYTERPPSAVNGSTSIAMSYVETIHVNSGDVLALYAWQDSGATLLVTNRKLTVTRVA